MVLANRPWRLVRDLSKVLVATLASAGFFIVNANAWAIADQLAFARLLLLAVLALGGLGVWLAVAHSLWERPSEKHDPALTRRVNVATALTLSARIARRVLRALRPRPGFDGARGPRAIHELQLGHPIGLGDYAAAAWFAASMAVVVGAIGSGLESDEEVRDTISRYRAAPPDESR